MAVLDKTSLVGDFSILHVDEDPTVTAVDGFAGDLIIYQSADGVPAVTYEKTSDGLTTDAQRLTLRHTYDASVAPTVTDDASKGYSHGSKWYDGTNLHECVDPTIGAAIWLQVV